MENRTTKCSKFHINDELVIYLNQNNSDFSESDKNRSNLEINPY